MATFWRISDMRVLENYALWVRFFDGLEGIVRFRPAFFRGVFSHLIDPYNFSRAEIVNGAVTWPGNLDLAPDAMHQEIKKNGEWIVDE
jgi:hypothetical protein